MLRKILFTVLAVSILVQFTLFSQTSPEEFLGHKVGADRKLADYTQIRDYFAKLDKESDKIKVLTIGKTTRGKPMIMAVITSEKNMPRLDEYRAIIKKLRDARNVSPEEAKKLAEKGKSILLITCSLHATEIAASQMSMELAYNLVTGKTPFDSEKALEDVILLLAPTINPDGEQMVTDWYRKYVGTKYEGGRMPWLYHDYAGHDNNRDWFMFNLPETKAVTKVLYHDWIPQIHMDEHQMGSTRARLFIPPFMDPPVPSVHPLVWRGVGLCGVNMAYDLQTKGKKGVVYDRSFTGWWIGACDDTSWLHNSVGLLSEMASVRTASPIFIDPSEVSDSYTEKRIKFPDPWPGGWWRLRHLVDYELILSMSLVRTAHLYKEDFLFNFYQMCKDGIEKREEGAPFAFVIPEQQRDYPTTLKMLDILKFGGVEIHRAKKDFIAAGKFYKAGSFVVWMAQPYRPYAQALLEKQRYPDMREYEGGPPIPPYDNAGWTLPLQMGVKCHRVDRPFKADTELLAAIPARAVKAPPKSAAYLVLSPWENAAYAVVFALLKEKAEIYRAAACIKAEKCIACPGSFIIKNTAAVRKALPGLLKKWPVEVSELDDISGVAKARLDKTRFALYRSWRSSMDEGWTRYVFDDFGVPYTSLRNKDFKGKGKQKVDLKKRFDVIVFADERVEIIKSGSPDPKSRYARWFTPLPPPYSGGIGKAGVEALKDFVAKGGILVTMNSASDLVIKDFKAPVSSALERVGRDKFFCPTSLLKVKVNNMTPIGYGMPPEAAVMFSRSPVFRTRVPRGEWNRTVVASYPKKDILMSGWLLGEGMIARRPALVDIEHKKGHIIMIGFRCQHRAQSHGTFKFLFNALLYPAAQGAY
ncbi:MAG: hypothetical protein KAW12_21910 [Candidatus Aminicenantes bacterium]|nr:hypothetical protein [Candidatus Aminicenantes bacterium]